MKKAFEIWIDDDAELSSFCGTVVSETEVKKGVTSICLSKAEIEGKAGYLFPIEGPGSFVILLEDDAESGDEVMTMKDVTDMANKMLEEKLDKDFDNDIKEIHEKNKKKSDILPSSDYRNNKCKDCKYLNVIKETEKVNANGRVTGKGDCKCSDVLNHPTMRQKRMYSDRACLHFKKKD